MGYSKSGSKREFYSDTSLPQETRNISNKQPNITLKATRERRINKVKVSKKKEIIKIRAATNKTLNQKFESSSDKMHETGVCYTERSQKDKHPYTMLIHIYGIQKDGNNDPMCKRAKEAQIQRIDFWTLWEKARVG